MVGTALGEIAGYYGGWIDSIIMRYTEAQLSIPLLFLLLVLSKFIGNKLPEVQFLGSTVSGSVFVIILVLGFTSWMGLARIVRANLLSLKHQEFVLAARAVGAGDVAIMFRHILPNTLAPVIVSATLGISNVILLESYVSFLGAGVQPPTASWGNMMDRALERLAMAMVCAMRSTRRRAGGDDRRGHTDADTAVLARCRARSAWSAGSTSARLQRHADHPPYE